MIYRITVQHTVYSVSPFYSNDIQRSVDGSLDLKDAVASVLEQHTPLALGDRLVISVYSMDITE